MSTSNSIDELRAYYTDNKPLERDVPPTIATISHHDLETIAFKKTSLYYPCESEQYLSAPSIRPNQTLKNVNEIGGSYDVFLYAPPMGWQCSEEFEMPAYVRRGGRRSQSEQERSGGSTMLAVDGCPPRQQRSPHHESPSSSSTTSVAQTRLPSSDPIPCLPYPLETESHMTASPVPSSSSSSSSASASSSTPNATATTSSSSSHPQPPSRPRPQPPQSWKSSPELSARAGRSSHKQSPYSQSQRGKGIRRESSKLSQQIYPSAASSSPSSRA
ncbi:hypothetical protein PM082_018918 [Marasmius tenuissimus]|nr:hypothetical protein PM082_018918 [Marasmius tenuissimus]